MSAAHTVCRSCRRVAAAGPRERCGHCGGVVEVYAAGWEAEARAAGLWFAFMREAREPEREGDGLARVDYTDPYFKEGR